MRLMRRLTIISFLFIFTLSSFGHDDPLVQQYKDLLRQSVAALTETTEDLKDARDIIVSLEGQISESDSSKDERIKELEDLLKRSEEALIESNKDLTIAKIQIEDDQVEIEDLRTNLKICIDNMPEIELFTLGIGFVAVPYGVQAFFMYDILKIPISLYTNANILLRPAGMNFTIGAAIRF